MLATGLLHNTYLFPCRTPISYYAPLLAHHILGLRLIVPAQGQLMAAPKFSLNFSQLALTCLPSSALLSPTSTPLSTPIGPSTMAVLQAMASYSIPSSPASATFSYSPAYAASLSPASSPTSPALLSLLCSIAIQHGFHDHMHWDLGSKLPLQSSPLTS
jgi:hypothetical protein